MAEHLGFVVRAATAGQAGTWGVVLAATADELDELLDFIAVTGWMDCRNGESGAQS